MANNHSTLTSLFADIADAIRAKTGSTEPIVADQFPEAITGISGGGQVAYGTVDVGNFVTGSPTKELTLDVGFKARKAALFPYAMMAFAPSNIQSVTAYQDEWGDTYYYRVGVSYFNSDTVASSNFNFNGLRMYSNDGAKIYFEARTDVNPVFTFGDTTVDVKIPDDELSIMTGNYFWIAWG